jgi:hypothetical protein
MSDGTETLDLETPEVPASGGGEASSFATDDASSDLEQDYEGDDAQTDDDGSDDEEELDLNGKKYRVNKELKPLLMMQQDYTRKTQEVAETRKALEARQAEIEQQAKSVQELNEDRKKLVVLDDWLSRQARVNWPQLLRDDPIEGPAKYAEFQHWQAQREQLNSKISDAEQQKALDEERKTATRIQQTFDEVKKIPGWSNEVAKKVESHALTYGLELKQLDKLVAEYGAPIVKMAHRAMLAEQLLAKQQAAAKSPSAPQEPVKPLAPVRKGNAPARTGLHDDLDTEEWARRRREQLRNRK